MKHYSGSECEVIFDTNAANTDTLTQGVLLTRTKTYHCADMLYVEVYPIWDTQTGRDARAHCEKARTSKAQAALNLRNARKRLERLINTNFSAGDIYLTLTYAPDQQPYDDAQARKDMVNYIRRLKTLRDKANIQSKLKYVYVTEITHGVNGTRYHHHAIISGDGIERDEVERVWRKGLVNSRRVQQLDTGLAGIVHYMTKSKDTQEKLARRFTCSKNLKQPTVTTSDHRITRRKAQRIAMAMQDDGRAIIEKAFNGYHVVDDIVIKKSDFVSGVYIYATLRREARRVDKERNSRANTRSGGRGSARSGGLLSEG